MAMNQARAAVAAARQRLTNPGRHGVAIAATTAGALLTALGTALIFLPAGIILAGLALGTAGLFGIDVDDESGA